MYLNPKEITIFRNDCNTQSPAVQRAIYERSPVPAHKVAICLDIQQFLAKEWLEELEYVLHVYRENPVAGRAEFLAYECAPPGMDSSSIFRVMGAKGTSAIGNCAAEQARAQMMASGESREHKQMVEGVVTFAVTAVLLVGAILVARAVWKKGAAAVDRYLTGRAK